MCDASDSKKERKKKERGEADVFTLCKQVIRQRGGSLINNYTNFLASLYLCRHNFQIRSEPYLDGALFVVSGRTCTVRVDLVRDPAFRAGYQDERYCFGLRGPLDADDDNYLTRFGLRRGWKIKIQCTAACRVTTRLGTPPPPPSLAGSCSGGGGRRGGATRPACGAGTRGVPTPGACTPSTGPGWSTSRWCGTRCSCGRCGGPARTSGPSPPGAPRRVSCPASWWRGSWRRNWSRSRRISGSILVI